jgi:hypothetical protein
MSTQILERDDKARAMLKDYQEVLSGKKNVSNTKQIKMLQDRLKYESQIRYEQEQERRFNKNQ